MIQFSNVDVYGWEVAIRGMRNPLNSWEKSDSIFGIDGDVIIGPNDKKLMMNLASAGSDHAKYKRMIQVSMDIVAPLYWWKEFDTYKVGTVANSCSTMHKIHDKEFTLDDFSYEHLIDPERIVLGLEVNPVKDDYMEDYIEPLFFLKSIIYALNTLRELYLKTKDKRYWYQMIQLLSSSYNQRRTVLLNYEVLGNMHHARKNHKLDEWQEFCKLVEILPYAELISPYIRPREVK